MSDATPLAVHLITTRQNVTDVLAWCTHDDAPELVQIEAKRWLHQITADNR